jgi:hypothetical protein
MGGLGCALTFGLALVPTGRIGDRYGYRRLFLTGLSLFTLASVACGVAANPGELIGSGQCPVMRYNRWLRDLIIRGQARPSRVISHELPLDEASGPMTSSISAPRAGPRSSSTRARAPDPHPAGEEGLRWGLRATFAGS